jgi:hypothetical protein
VPDGVLPVRLRVRRLLLALGGLLGLFAAFVIGQRIRSGSQVSRPA